MPDLTRLKERAVELGVNAVLPAYSTVASKVNELGETRVGRLVENVAARGLDAVGPAVDRAQRLVPSRRRSTQAPAKPATKKPGSTRPKTNRSKAPLEGMLVAAPEPKRVEDLPIVGYDALLAEEVMVRLKGLTQSELAQVYKYERAKDARTTVLDAIEGRLIDLPLPTYDSLRVAAILDAVNGLTRKELYTIHEYERSTRNRLPILEKIDNLLAS